jgi:hypothetical protein
MATKETKVLRSRKVVNDIRYYRKISGKKVPLNLIIRHCSSGNSFLVLNDDGNISIMYLC